jgi:CHAD domain-containing protein
MKSPAISQYASRVIPVYLATLGHNQQRLSRKNHRTALHDVRVACRRLRTSLWIFKDVLPKEKRRVWKESLKRFAKTLGQARDLDVQIAFLKKIASRGQSHADSEALNALITTLQSKRLSLQENILHARNCFVKEKTLEHIQEYVTQHKDDPSTIEFNELKRQKILQRLKEFLSYKKFVYKPKKARELHRMRIAAKHLRYTIEIFSHADQDFKPYIAYARRLQRILGHLHDFDVWGKRLHSIELHTAHAREVSVTAYLAKHYKMLRTLTYHRFVKSWERQQKKKVWDTLEKLLDK